MLNGAGFDGENGAASSGHGEQSAQMVADAGSGICDKPGLAGRGLGLDEDIRQMRRGPYGRYRDGLGAERRSTP